MSKAIETRHEKEMLNMKTVAMKLEDYMDRVTEKECTPATVQAAVNCADKIVDILRLHLEVQRLNAKIGKP